MTKWGAGFDLDAYAPVAERIRLFYERFPQGRIITKLVSRTGGEVVFKALVFRCASDARAAATGWASEREGDSDINLIACLENSETSAIGRALANLGFTATRERPSAEEMEKAARARARLAHTLTGRARQRADTASVNTSPVVHTPLNAPATPETGSDARLADATLDALRLLGSAERAGLAPARAESLRVRLRAGVSLRSIERLESALRRWIARRARPGWLQR